MIIDDRYVGDTTPLVLWLSEVENEKEIPLEIATDTTSIEFRFKKDDEITKSILGENGTDDGRLEIPFAIDSVAEGEYVYNVKVTYTNGKTKTFGGGIMNINGVV